MDIIKEIINCETNTKFVKVYDDGRIEIPDVIFYVLYESGDTDVVGCCLGEGYPQIAGEVENEECHLQGSLEGDSLDDYLNYMYDDFDEAVSSVKTFVKEAKKLLPYLCIEKSVDEWMEEH